MRNKCKICGYRFKSNDEAICPECFTARGDDISCAGYGKDEHSHQYNVSQERRSFDNTTYNVNDTFDEGGNSFIDDERREERKNSFANREQNQANETNNYGSIMQNNSAQNSYASRQSAMSNDNATYNRQQSSVKTTPYTYQQNSFANNSNTYQQNFTNRNYQYKYNPSTRPQRNSSSATKIVVIIIVIICIVVFVQSAISSYNDDYIINSDDYTYSYTDPNDRDYGYTGIITGDVQTNMGTDGIYSVTQDYYYGFPRLSSDLDDNEINALISGYDNNSDWYETTLSYSINNNNADEPIQISSMLCTSYADDGTIISECNPLYKNFPITYYNQTDDFTANFICPVDADYSNISMTVSYGSNVQQFDYTITF